MTQDGRIFCLLFCVSVFALPNSRAADSPPNIVLVMADDMGWGQTGYYNHPVLKTPNLDAMAKNGLRFDRFYAGASNCSPTRATVMTGRTNERTGVLNHGVPLRPQEITIARLLSEAGYRTAHFGKWHLNGLRGPGAPILKDDIRSPGRFGFQEWLSVTNFFDKDPILSRKGTFEQHTGDSSEIVVAEALKFITDQAKQKQAFFTVIWYGTPHSPFIALDKDKAHFPDLDEASANHYGELVAMDRSIGTLRKGLKDLKIADNTLFWFCSDNGGLPKIKPGTVGDLRGFKNTLYEGGLRVPAIIEWPAKVSARITKFPCGTIDILPTLLDVTQTIPKTKLPQLDGFSLSHLFDSDLPDANRDKPLGFRHADRWAWIDNDIKLVKPNAKKDTIELYDLSKDQSETNDLAKSKPELAARMKTAFDAWNKTVEDSIAGLDYPEGKVIPPDPGPRSWPQTEEYAPYIDGWRNRREFKRYIK